MKVAVILLAAGVLILGVLYFSESRDAKTTYEQLLVTSNQVVAVETKMASVKKEMGDRVADLETTLGSEKAKAQERIGQLQERIATVEKDLQDEKDKLASVEDDRTKVVNQLTAVSNQLVSVRGRYADLARTHTTTEIELKALREREETLEMEKVSLERQLNDLDSLKAQIRLVKRQIWEKRAAEWRQQDQEATAAGNKGMIFQKGQWLTIGKRAS